jgi:hypothetical protein
VALRENTPELLQACNCTAWFEMGAPADGKPVVVHPRDVKERGIFIAGKAQHCVCGSKAMELAPAQGQAGLYPRKPKKYFEVGAVRRLVPLRTPRASFVP